MNTLASAPPTIPPTVAVGLAMSPEDLARAIAEAVINGPILVSVTVDGVEIDRKRAKVFLSTDSASEIALSILRGKQS